MRRSRICVVLLLLIAAAPAPSTRPATVNPRAVDPADTSIAPEVAKVLTAKLVTLSLTDTPALEALEKIAQQTGYTIKPASDSWFRQGGQRPKNVTVSLNAQPFWAAVREVCSRGNINLWNSGGDEARAVQIAPGNYGGQGMMRAPASIQGPFLSIVNNIRRINHVDMLKPGEKQQTVHVQIQTFAEPGVRVMRMSYQPRATEAVDDNGNSLAPPPSEERNQHMQSSRGISWHGNITLPYPSDNPGTRITRLKGTIDASIQLQSEPVEFADPLNTTEVTKTVASRRITFKSLKKQGGESNYAAEIAFHRDGQDSQTFNRGFEEQPVLRLIDDAGRTYTAYNSGGSSDGETRKQNFTFRPSSRGSGQGVGTPVKLEIEVPTATQDVQIPFELLDLPLP